MPLIRSANPSNQSITVGDFFVMLNSAMRYFHENRSQTVMQMGYGFFLDNQKGDFNLGVVDILDDYKMSADFIRNDLQLRSCFGVFADQDEDFEIIFNKSFYDHTRILDQNEIVKKYLEHARNWLQKKMQKPQSLVAAKDTKHAVKPTTASPAQEPPIQIFQEAQDMAESESEDDVEESEAQDMAESESDDPLLTEYKNTVLSLGFNIRKEESSICKIIPNISSSKDSVNKVIKIFHEQASEISKILESKNLVQKDIVSILRFQGFAKLKTMIDSIQTEAPRIKELADSLRVTVSLICNTILHRAGTNLKTILDEALPLVDNVNALKKTINAESILRACKNQGIHFAEFVKHLEASKNNLEEIKKVGNFQGSLLSHVIKIICSDSPAKRPTLTVEKLKSFSTILQDNIDMGKFSRAASSKATSSAARPKAASAVASAAAKTMDVHPPSPSFAIDRKRKNDDPKEGRKALKRDAADSPHRA